LYLSFHQIAESPENETFYRPVTEDDPATIELCENIRENGLLDPLVLSADYYLLSGHRRFKAGYMAGLRKFPCRIHPVERGHGDVANPEFTRLLLAYNRQRVKTRDEQLREEVALINPDKEYAAVTAHRKARSRVKLKPIELRQTAGRYRISEAKMPFVKAIQGIIARLVEYLPLSLRQIHYQLLNEPPLIHAAKPGSYYRNDYPSYHALCDLATRARHEGYIDYEAIHDPTRPVLIWNVHRNVHFYYGEQLDTILTGYARDLLQSQPDHIELIVEKNTVQSLVEPGAMNFCIPLSSARGQHTTTPLYDVAQRYRESGKGKLLILALSDLDPDGDAIAHSMAQRLRDDHDIEHVQLFKVALTIEQVTELGLTESYQPAKEGSPNYRRYVERYGHSKVWELEAVEPAILQGIVEKAIDAVINRKAYNQEVSQEKQDLAHIAAVRKIIVQTIRGQLGM
jgi:ParB-like nuclease domain